MRRWSPFVVLFAISKGRWVQAGGEFGAPAGDFDYWVLALNWQNEWSKDEPCDSVLAQQLAAGAPAAWKPGLHGLWPDFDASLPERHGKTYPEYCVSADGVMDFETCAQHEEEDYCSLKPDTVALFDTPERWQDYALEYSWGDDLAVHEWTKHGGCTGWPDQETFFGQAEAVYRRIEAESQGFALLKANVGRSVQYNALQAAFAADLGGKTPGLRCAGACELSEIWIAFERDAESGAPGLPLENTKDDECGSQGCMEIKILDFSRCGAPSPDAEADAEDDSTFDVPEPAKDTSASGAPAVQIWIPVLVAGALIMAGAIAADHIAKQRLRDGAASAGLVQMASISMNLDRGRQFDGDDVHLLSP